MDPTSRSAAIYYRLPAFAQNALLTAAGIKHRRQRYGPEFSRRLAQMRKSAGWDRARIESHQDEQVARLVAHAYATTRYYRRVMDDRGLTPADVRGVADLPKLPPLTKDDIRDHLEDLVSSEARRRSLLPLSTSGSSGDPLTLLTTREALGFKWATWWRHREWHGARRGQLHLNVMNKPIVRMGASRPPFWRWNRLERHAMLPMQQLRAPNIPIIVAFLNRTPFEFYSGYPSIVHSLAVQALELGLRLDAGPPVVFTGAEGVTDQQRDDVREFAGAYVAEMYGFNEGAGNASSCREMNLHEDIELGHLECADPATEEATGIATGRVLATGFATTAFPLIRYDVGDVASWHPDWYRCACGRESRVLARIDGRWEDYIVTPEGHQARRLGDLFKELPNLKQWQLRQERPDGVILRIVRRTEYSQADEDTLRRRVAVWIGKSLDVEFDYVDAIAPAPNGKHQRIVSTLRSRLSGPSTGSR